MGDERSFQHLNPLGITIIIRDVFHNIALGQNKWAFRQNKWLVWKRPSFTTVRAELHESLPSIRGDSVILFCGLPTALSQCEMSWVFSCSHQRDTQQPYWLQLLSFRCGDRMKNLAHLKDAASGERTHYGSRRSGRGAWASQSWSENPDKEPASSGQTQASH